MQINKENYEAFLIDYLHGELNPVDTKAVMEFIEENEWAAEEFKLLQDTVFHPEEDIYFENKEVLYRKEETRRAWTIQYKRYFAIAAILGGIFITYYFLLKKDQEPSYAQHEQEKTPTQPILPPAQVMEEKRTERIKKVSSPNTATAQVNNKRPKEVTTEKQPIMEEHPDSPNPIVNEAIVVQSPREEIREWTPPPTHKESDTPVITQAKQTNKETFTPEEDNRVANRIASTRNVEWNSEKKPKLFRLINGVLGISRKLKQKEEQLSNTQVTVMVGNKILFNINN